MKVPGYFLPEAIRVAEEMSLDFGDVTVEVPRLTPDLLGRIIDHLVESQDRFLARRPVDEILDALDRTIARWLDRGDPFRRIAEEALPATTRLSLEMIVHGLSAVLEGYRKEPLLKLLEGELHDPLVLDTFRPRAFGRSRAFGPRLTTHILSGNIPALAAPSLILACLAKSASLAKPASEEPIFPALFARSLAEVDPALGGCIAVVWWKGGEEALEEVAFSRSDVVIAYGALDALRSIRARVPGQFIGHGHRLSLGVIGREALSNLTEVAARAAYDASMFDQQGCLSPHLFYVERGGPKDPEALAKALADAMEALHKRLPRGRLSPEEASAIQQLRGAYEFQGIVGKDVMVYAGEGTSWTVIYEKDPTFVTSCLNRTIWVKPVEDLREVPGLLTPYREYLSTVGVAVSPDRLDPLAEAFGRLGVNRICPLGGMQHPPIGWHHDGRFQLLDLLRWVDLEEVGGGEVGGG